MGWKASWMLFKTSLFTSSASNIFLFESLRVIRARLVAISPHPAAELPRCGVPRKTISLVRVRQVTDLLIACGYISFRPCAQRYQRTFLTIIPPRLCATNMIGSYVAVVSLLFRSRERAELPHYRYLARSGLLDLGCAGTRHSCCSPERTR